jgi:hypothetical protein
MPFYPDLHDVSRGNIGKPEYAGEYKIPLLDTNDFDKLVQASHTARQDKIKRGEDSFKELQKLQPNGKNFGFFTLPSLIEENNRLLDAQGVNDANYNAAANGDPFIMRKLQAGMMKHSNSIEFQKLAAQQSYFNQFAKDAEKITDPNLKNQAFASIAAAMAGEPDPATEVIMKPTDFNIGNFAPMDLEKSLSDGLAAIKVKNESVNDLGGMQAIELKSTLDPTAAKEFITAYTKNPAVQRNLAARGYGLNHPDGFHLNEDGQAWIKNILDAQTKSVNDVKSIRFNTKEFNTQGSRVDAGLPLDDIANTSIDAVPGLVQHGNQMAREMNYSFNEDTFMKGIGLKLSDPVFRKKLVDDGYMKEDGTYTDKMKQAREYYSQQLKDHKILSTKNIPKASSSSSAAKGSNGRQRVKDTFAKAGIIMREEALAGLDLSKKVNYTIVPGDTPGKYYLRVGETDKNDRLLKPGVDYDIDPNKINGPAPNKSSATPAKPDNKKTPEPAKKSKFF